MKSILCGILLFLAAISKGYEVEINNVGYPDIIWQIQELDLSEENHTAVLKLSGKPEQLFPLMLIFSSFSAMDHNKNPKIRVRDYIKDNTQNTTYRTEWIDIPTERLPIIYRTVENHPLKGRILIQFKLPSEETKHHFFGKLHDKYFHQKLFPASPIPEAFINSIPDFDGRYFISFTAASLTGGVYHVFLKLVEDKDDRRIVTLSGLSVLDIDLARDLFVRFSNHTHNNYYNAFSFLSVEGPIRHNTIFDANYTNQLFSVRQEIAEKKNEIKFSYRLKFDCPSVAGQIKILNIQVEEQDLDNPGGFIEVKVAVTQKAGYILIRQVYCGGLENEVTLKTIRRRLTTAKTEKLRVEMYVEKCDCKDSCLIELISVSEVRAESEDPGIGDPTILVQYAVLPANPTPETQSTKAVSVKEIKQTNKVLVDAETQTDEIPERAPRTQKSVEMETQTENT